MSFASPLLLLGLSAAAIPLIIHLIGKRRAPRRRFAAIEFLFRSNRRIAQRLRLRQIVLLLVRMALAGGIAAMMAKPFTETESELPAVGSGPQSSVLVLDDTMSMGLKVEGSTLLSRAKRRARQIVEQLGGQADVAVIRVSTPSEPLPVLTRDSRKITSAIASVGASFAHRDLTDAMELAGRILAESSMPERHIFLISDMAAHGWAAEGLKVQAGAQLHPVDVAKGLTLGNQAVAGLEAVSSAAPGQRSVKIRARVCNYSAAPVSERIALSVLDEEVARGLLELKPWSCGTKTFEHTFAKGGMQNAAVSLEGDGLTADDQRYLRMEVESTIRVLLVNGAPSAVRHRDELFYLETALLEQGPDGQAIVTKTTTPGELKQVQLSSFEVVALCNVGRLPEAQVNDLEGFVRAGGGLLVSVGDNVEPGAFTASLGRLSPVDLRGPLTTSPPGTGAPPLRIGRVDSTHPMLAPIWTEKRGAGLRQALFSRVYRIRPAPRSHRRVIFWYEDGSPALVEGAIGEGRVLLFTSTVDRDWTDLPIRPGYLPLVQQMARYLGRVALQAPRRSVAVGSVVGVPVKKTTRRVHLTDPNGSERHWSPRELRGKNQVEVPVELPGFYHLSAAGADGVLHTLDRESFVANVDPAESDPRQASYAELADKGQRSGISRAMRRVELWHGVGALLLLLLLLESFLTRRG